MSSFLLALQILTRVPLPARPAAQVGDLSRSIMWFPIAGATIGVLVATVDLCAGRIFAPPMTGAIVVFTLVATTGAFHLDGLIDTVDGVVAGPDPDARLAAMRQSVAGVPGALAGCGMVFALYVAVLSLPSEMRFHALFLAPVCARTTILTGYRLFPYGRTEAGLSRALKDGATTKRAMLGTGLAIAITAATAAGGGVLLLAGSLAGAVALGIAACVRLRGLTGDVHGAICEIAQLGVLLSAPALLGR
jgi:cobalamin 5'-phosphate synthase/cobalamin synthase